MKSLTTYRWLGLTDFLKMCATRERERELSRMMYLVSILAFLIPLKLIGLKLHTSITVYNKFLWVKNPGTSYLVFYFKASPGCYQDVCRAVVTSRINLGSSASKVTCLLIGFSSSWAVGLRVSVPHWMLLRDHPQFLAMWVSSTWQVVSLKDGDWEVDRV